MLVAGDALTVAGMAARMSDTAASEEKRMVRPPKRLMPCIVAANRAPAVTRSSSNGRESSVKGLPKVGELTVIRAPTAIFDADRRIGTAFRAFSTRTDPHQAE